MNVDVKQFLFFRGSKLKQVFYHIDFRIEFVEKFRFFDKENECSSFVGWARKDGEADENEFLLWMRLFFLFL